MAVLAAAFITATIPGVIAVWRGRKNGPDSTAVVLTASATYLTEMHARLEALEQRVERLERENRAYYRLHGPLPVGEEHR